MTSLNSKLKLALINRKKGRNLLEKGFTLVELMIVIVIVGILSAVALPNFLNQTDKAKSTEATTKVTSLLKQASAEALGGTTATALTTMNAASGPVATATTTGQWTYTMAAGATAADDIVITATPKPAGTAAGGPTSNPGVLAPLSSCRDHL